MNLTSPTEKQPAKAFGFWIHFTVCVLGTAVFLLFVFGVESGHAGANRLLEMIVGHIGWVFLIGVLICAWSVWSVKSKQRKNIS